MSHKYPFGRTPSGSARRPDPGPYSSSDRPHSSSHQDFYSAPQESPSSSSSSRGWSQSQDGALSILSSCGLEPGDLSLLAELPEDVLTVESLPRVLQQMKGKRGAMAPFCPNAPSSSSSSYPPSSAPQPAATDWTRLRSQPVQYPLHHLAPSCPPSQQVQDHWGNPRTSSSSSSSSHVVDFHHPPGLSEYGKTGRAASPASSQDRASFRSAGPGQRSRPSRFSEPGLADGGLAPPPGERGRKPRGGHLRSQTSWVSRPAAAASMPSTKEAVDFHGTSPGSYPYSCSLCDITVLSERDWTKHVNGPQHADGQLHLLQQFPRWDCRLETVNRANGQSERRKAEEAANQRQKPQLNRVRQQKAPDKGKVVCVKFPAQSVDEAYLRKLTEPFGKIVKILMFPSLAFVELGSVDQAKDLVKFHGNYPPTVNGEQIQFSISSTFHFLQSSRVVTFSPAPTGEDGQSDLMSIVRRFGPPLYTLFLPSMAFVEMKNAPDAQKLVDYYSSNTLRINNDSLKVSFSGEYKSLAQVASAQRFEEEETSSSKRERSQSQEKETKETKRRRRSVSLEEETKRRRSSSKDRTDESRSTSTDKSRNKSSSRRSRSRSRSRSREKSSGRSTKDESREKTEEPERTDSRTDPGPEPRPLTETRPESAENEQSEEETESSAYDSDIEGMEVIGEDLEEDEEDEDEDEDEEEAAEGTSGSAEKEEEEKEKLEEQEKKKLEDSPREADLAAEPLEEEEKKSSNRRRSESRTCDTDETCRQTEGSEESRSKRSTDKRSVSTDGPEQEPAIEKTVEEELTPKTPSGETLRTAPEKETDETSENLCVSRKSPDMKSMSEKTGEDSAATRPQQILDKDLEVQEGSGSGSADPDRADCTRTHQKPQDEPIRDLGQRPGPVEPERPSKPVGTEFVRPVVGYFCHLCQVIYADEDEAKLQHCRSPTHYRKYQEKTGIDPWTS